MLSVHPRPWYERRALALAAAMFAFGIAVGNMANSDLVGRQLTANAAPAAPATANTLLAIGMHPAEVLRVLDGDTFEARVRVWPGLDITTKIRLRSIDAPELKAHCADERSRAEAARDALKRMLAEGGVAVSHVGLDKYGGRVLADVATRATPDIGAAMLAKRLARAYGGGHRESWCSGT